MTVRQRGGPNSKDDGQSSSDSSKQSGPFSGRFNPKFQGRRPERTADGSALNHKLWSRIVMVASIALVIYWSQSNEKVTIMAKQAEVISPKRFQSFLCAPSYKKEIQDVGNKGCMPAKCGRMVTDTLIDLNEANQLLALAKKGLAKGGGSGGASILDLHSGALSKEDAFISLYESFPDLYSPSDFEIYSSIKDKVKAAVADHFGIDFDSLYLTHPTFFSRLDNRPSSVAHDEYWHVHVDKETYPAFHYTSLIYLTDFGVDFKGGDFVFVDNHDKLNRTIQPRMGRVSMFTSGIENKHYVERVTEGTRYALTIGFTCDKKSAIPEPGSEAHVNYRKKKLEHPPRD